MNAFSNAIDNQEARTENNMKTLKTAGNACVEFFFKVAASRNKDILPVFIPAYVENREIALRILLWARDIREGAGERKTFRDILKYLEVKNLDDATLIMNKTPDLGRWDDIFIVSKPKLKMHMFEMVKRGLNEKNGLLAKWLPRKGELATELRKFLELTPKQYRKTVVNLSKTVEQQMCAKQWGEINYSHVPSVAHSRYKKAFWRNDKDRYESYVEALKSPDKSKNVKINANAIFPHDVIRSLSKNSWRINNNVSQNERNVIIAQWDALPNFIGSASIIPLVDVSGSMFTQIDSSGLKAIDVSLSLGLYCADKNKGPFKDVFLTFSERPELINLKGDVVDKIIQMSTSHWAMNTNLHAAFNKILDVAVKNNVPVKDMPQTLLILSDMQFDSCVTYDDSAIEMIRRKYERSGYNVPNIVFWNLNSKDNTPVRFDERGTALVSGYSPSILKSVVSADMEKFTSYQIMLDTVMIDRYNV